MKNKLLVLFLVSILLFTHTSPVLAQDAVTYPEYVIRSGDTLIGIALMFNVSVDDIINLNNIADSNQIYPGLRIKIPDYPGISGTIGPVTVGIGETWQDLMIKFQANDQMIININHLLNAYSMPPGTTLLIPVQNEGAEYAPVAMVDDDSTFLEQSVIVNENPSFLVIQNKKGSPINFFSKDLVYSSSASNLPIANPVSNSLGSFSISPLPLVQGETISIKLSTKQPLSLEGDLNGSPLHFYSQDNQNYFALQGIYAMADPGLVNFSIKGINGSDEVFSYQQSIELSSGNFEIDPPLSVDPAMIDPAYTVPELEKIQSITSIFTPEKYWEGTFLSPDSDYGTEIANYDLLKEITSYFGSRRTYNDDPTVTFHTGVDFGGGEGLPIVASANGKVVFAGFLDVRGNATIIDHGLGVYSAYYHQSEISVKVGDVVQKGQRIGKVGNTGRVDRSNEYAGAGAHLHWEIWVNGVQVNPLDWVNSEYP